MYHHPRVDRIMTDAESVVRGLFGRYMASPNDLPTERQRGLSKEEAARARQIGDFIAGMTDRFAVMEHRRLFDSTPELR
jgi:dGTPase